MNPAALSSRAFHVWFSTKGRKPVLVEEIRDVVLRLLETNVEKAGTRLVEVEAIEDHVHLLVELQNHQSLATVMHRVKGASAREVFLRYPELRLDMQSNSFWQKSYGARPVPLKEMQTVRDYIRTQGERPLRHE
jgi:REP-associated tyrosine transposase